MQGNIADATFALPAAAGDKLVRRTEILLCQIDMSIAEYLDPLVTACTMFLE
jgi:hypothetical protein